MVACTEDGTVGHCLSGTERQQGRHFGHKGCDGTLIEFSPAQLEKLRLEELQGRGPGRTRHVESPTAQVTDSSPCSQHSVGLISRPRV